MANNPRGVRNNNPGNIDYNPRNQWDGQLGLEINTQAKPRFARFDTAENGIRALGKLLQTYYNKHGLRTIRKILVRYAPDFENDTGAYISTVAKRSGIGGDQEIRSIKDPKVLGSLMHAIIRHECANYEYPEAVFAEGLKRALA